LRLSKTFDVYFVSFSKYDISEVSLNHIRNICKTVDVFKPIYDQNRFMLVLGLLFNLFNTLPFVVQKYNDVVAKKRILMILKENDIKMIHVDILPLAVYLPLFYSCKKVLVEHNVEYLRLKSWVNKEKNIFVKMYLSLQVQKVRNFEKQACGKFDLCIVVSENDKRNISSMNPRARILIIPNGVDVDYFKNDNTITQEPNSIIWVGGTGEFYNRNSLINFLKAAFPLIVRKVPNLIFYIIGTVNSRELLGLVEKYSKNIKILGEVEDIRPWVCRAMAYVAPICSGGGTKIKVLNAMALSKVVVTTTCGAEGIDVLNGKELFIADSPNDFAERTIFLLKEKEIRNEMGRLGRELIVQKYSWEKILADYDDIYLKLLDS